MSVLERFVRAQGLRRGSRESIVGVFRTTRESLGSQKRELCSVVVG